MSNEWLEIAWINFAKAIMHGQYINDGAERQVEQVLTEEQIEAVHALNAKHEAAMFRLLRSFLP